MASLPHVTCVGVVFAALLIPAPEALAQTHRADYESESRLGSSEAAPGLGAPVLNAPFSADAVTTWRPNEPSERSEWRASMSRSARTRSWVFRLRVQAPRSRCLSERSREIARFRSWTSVGSRQSCSC